MRSQEPRRGSRQIAISARRLARLQSNAGGPGEADPQTKPSVAGAGGGCGCGCGRGGGGARGRGGADGGGVADATSDGPGTRTTGGPTSSSRYAGDCWYCTELASSITSVRTALANGTTEPASSR